MSELSARNRTAHSFTFAVLSLSYVLFNIITVQRFSYSFWWDELTVLQQSELGPSNLLLSHWGNWFPFGRFVFLVETKIFGTTYWLYVMLNAILALTLSVILSFIIRHLEPRTTTPVLYALMATYLMSPGILYDVQWGYQIVWLMSMIFGLMAVLSLIKRPNKKARVLILLMLSFLAFSSTILIIGIVLFLCWSLSPEDSRQKEKYNSRAANCFLAFSLFLFLLGQLCARLFLPHELGAQASPIFLNYTIDSTLAVLEQLIAGFFTWTVSPIFFYPNLGFYEFKATVEFILSFSVLLVAIISVFVFIKYYSQSKNQKILSKSLFNNPKYYFFLLPTFILMALVSLRGFRTVESFSHVRYGPVALLGPLIFYALVSSPNSVDSVKIELRLFLRNWRLITALIFICSILTTSFALHSPSKSAESGRVRDSILQQTIINNYCWDEPDKAKVLPGISNDFSGQELCKIHRDLTLNRFKPLQ
ncbi:MAG: hypothetical protein NT097_02955 [Actinobacteria bacterium]|nr:hypothetical protein [Actinomycetota bacterium]